MTKKRGQISIFLILSAVIMLLGIIYVIFQKSETGIIKEIAPEFSPVKTFVEQCLKNSLEDGIEKIGRTGGYIEYPSRLSNPRSYYTPLQGSGFKIPYWWHDGVNAVPTEDFIKLQLNDYAKKSALSCINDFKDFDQGYDVKPKGELKIDVSLNDDDVSVRAAYPLKVILKSNNLLQDMNNFEYKSPIRLKKVYGLAKKIVEQENKDYFLEEKTIDLLTMETEDIPTTDMAFSCKSKTWKLQDVKKEMEELLNTNIPYISIEGTDFNKEVYVPNPCTLPENKNTAYCKDAKDQKNTYSSTYFNDHYVWQIDKNAVDLYSNIKVGFRVPSNIEKFDARPKNGNTLRSNVQPMQSALKFLCIHTWHFTYDIGYPVLINIYDKESKKNKDYSFNFAFKVNVINNQPSRENKGSVSFESESSISDEEFCNDAAKGNVIIRTQTASGGAAVDDANLKYICGQFICDLGSTQLSSNHDVAGLITQLPRCASGTLTSSKDGFIESSLSNVISDNKDREYYIDMKQIKEFPKCVEKNDKNECVKSTSFRVKKHTIVPPFKTAVPSSTTSDLAADGTETATIIIKDKNSDFESAAVYPPPQDGAPLQLLMDTAIYDVEIYLSKNDELVGAYKGEWNVDPYKLKDAADIVFHVVGFDIITSLSQEEKDNELGAFLDNIDLYSSKIPKPELN